MKKYLFLLITILSIQSFAQTLGSGFSDIDGNVYRSVIIDSQEWMASNLKVKHFQDGSPITYAQSDKEWLIAAKNQSAAWCYVDTILKDEVLYNWYAVNDPRGLAPKDWFIPTSSDFSALNNYIACIDVYSQSGTHVRDAVGWGQVFVYTKCDSCYRREVEIGLSLDGKNTTGFSAKPIDTRIISEDRNSYLFLPSFNNHAIWWSITSVMSDMGVTWELQEELVKGKNDGGQGFSIRCIKPKL